MTENTPIKLSVILLKELEYFATNKPMQIVNPQDKNIAKPPNKGVASE